MVKISKVSPTTTVSPSSTASRMGVVSVSVPSISTITGTVADQLNSIGEAQAKLYDANWMNDYEFNTGMYINNKVSEIIQSGENPNLEAFTTEMTAYNDSVLANAPERLKIAADGYFQQKFINSFEILRDQSNAITFADAEIKYNTWRDNIIVDEEDHFLKLSLTAPNPEAMMDSIHEYSATVLTRALAVNKEKYESLMPFSQGKYNESTLQQTELGLLIEVEVARNNAILRSFYQNIDITNPEEVAAADMAANQYINNYIKDKNNVRGINYNIFKDETGKSISEQTVKGIIDESEKYLGQLRSVNTTKAVKQSGMVSANNYKDYKDLDDNLNNLSYWGPNSLFVIRNDDAAPGSPNTYREWTFNEFFETYKDKFSESEIYNLYDANTKKNFVKRYMDEAIANIGDPEVSFKSLIQSNNFKQMNIGASEDELMQGYLQYALGDDYVDSPSYYDNASRETRTQLNNLFRKEQYVPNGMVAWLNAVNPAKMEDTPLEELPNLLSNRLSTYANITSNGLIANNINKNVSAMYDEMINLQTKGFDFQEIAQHFKRKSKYTETELTNMNNVNKSFLDENIGNYSQYWIDYYVQSQKVRRKDMMTIQFGEDGITTYKGQGLDETSLVAELEAEAMAIYKKSSRLIDEVIQNNTLEYMNLISNVDDDNNDIQRNLNKAIRNALENRHKDNFGTSSFMDDNPGTAYVYLPITQMHSNLKENQIGDALTSYVYNNVNAILSDPNNQLYEDVASQFSVGGQVEIPNHQEIRELIQQGNIYVTAVDNGFTGISTMYEVHIANSGTQFDEPYGYDMLNHLSFDGSYFNPSIYTGIVGQDGQFKPGVLTKEFFKDLVDGNLVLDGDMQDMIQQKYLGPILRKLKGGENVDKLYSELLFQLYTGQQVDFRDIGK